MFEKATRTQSKARVLLVGPSGSGKTFSALLIAQELGNKIAVIDTERGTASKYVGENGLEFDVCNLTNFDPDNFTKLIEDAERAGYDVLVIDSLTHAWSGKGGCLDIVEGASTRNGNTYTAWAKAKPKNRGMMDAMNQSGMHIIATVRAKSEYVMDKDPKGRTEIKKVGMGAIQDKELDYEFDLVGMMDREHNMIVDKTRCPAFDGKVIHKPGKDVAVVLRTWLTDGAEGAQKFLDKVNGAVVPSNKTDETVVHGLRERIQDAKTAAELMSVASSIQEAPLDSGSKQELRTIYRDRQKELAK